MLFNKNIVLDLLQTQFGEKIEQEVIQAVCDMDNYILESIFDMPVDYADVDAFDEMNMIECEAEAENGIQIVSGIFEIGVFVNGYAYWDGADEYIDSSEVTLTFSFSFHEKNGVYSEFQLEQL